jgi:hypothetical protein
MPYVFSHVMKLSKQNLFSSREFYIFNTAKA